MIYDNSLRLLELHINHKMQLVQRQTLRYWIALIHKSIQVIVIPILTYLLIGRWRWLEVA